MSKRYNNAGRELVVDRLIELKRRGTSDTVSRIQSSISGQQIQKDLDALKDALNGITSDGTISASEKPGLKREWASLQNSYVSIAEQFTSNPDLENNPAFIALRQQYVTLAELMDKILADMTTDYTGEEVKQLSDMFVNLYQQLTVCQTVLNGINDFQRNYTINITGSREVLDGSQLTAGIYRGGTEQMNPEFIDGTNYTWRRLDEADSFTPRNGKSILLTSDDLPISPCRFSVTWRDEEEQEVSLSIIFELTWGTIKEYAWSNALTVEDLQGMMPSAWYELPPLQPTDMDYLWRRESTDNGKTWQYFRENGENGGAPQYFYKYTKTDDPMAYIGGGALFVYRNKVFAVGKTLLGAGMAGWVDHVPQGEQYQDDYLWTKIVHADGTYDIIPPAQKGENAKDIRIVASIDSYQLSTRGMVLVDQEFTFALQRWYVNGTATWKVDPDPEYNTNDLEIIPQDNPDILKLKIKAGSYLDSFVVSVSCEGFEATRDLRVFGIIGGEERPWYFKVYPEDPNGELPVYNRETGVVDFGNSIWPTESPEGNLITGDYILYKTKVIQNASDTEGHVEPVPYYFVEGEGTGDAGHWKMLDENSPYYSEAMGTMLGDVVKMDDMPVTIGAMYGFFKNLAAYNAFITNLFAHTIKIEDDGAIYGGGYEADGSNPEGLPGFHLSWNGILQAVSASLRNAIITGTLETYDENGIIFRTDKDVAELPVNTSVDDAYVGYSYGNASLALDDSYIYRQTAGGVQYKDWNNYAIPLSSSIAHRDNINAVEPSISAGITDVREFFGNLILAHEQYGAAYDPNISSDYTVEDSVLCPIETTVVAVFTLDASAISGSHIFSCVLTKNGDEENSSMISSMVNSSYSNRVSEACLAINVSAGDSINIGMQANGVSLYGMSIDVYFVSKLQKVPTYAGSDQITHWPYGYQSCFFVEYTGHENTVNIPLAEAKELDVINQDYSGTPSLTTIQEYQGPTVLVYKENDTLAGSIYDPATLYRNDVSLQMDYKPVLASVPIGEYPVISSSVFEGSNVTRVVVNYGTNNAKRMDFYGGNAGAEILLGWVCDKMPFYNFSISIASGLRGIRTASIYPDSDNKYDIGASGNRYRRIYADTVNATTVSADTVEISGGSTTNIKLPNGYSLYIHSFGGYAIPGLDEGEWIEDSYTVPSAYSIMYGTYFVSTNGSHPAEPVSVVDNTITLKLWTLEEYQLAILVRRI